MINEKYYTLPVPVTLANGTSLSAGINLDTGGGLSPFANGWRLCGLIMPAAWDAAGVTFQGSADGVTYYDLYDSTGVEYNVSAASSRAIKIPPADFFSFPYIKVRSGTTGTPVNQTADRVLQLLMRQI